MIVSASGRAFIAQFEGCVLHTYLDTAGVPTIGIGCTGPEAWPGRVITQGEADKMFAERLAKEFEPGVNAAIGDAPTTQPQFDAMASLAFNIGVGGFARSSICSQHKAGNYTAAADRFSLYIMSAGRVLEPLRNRRLMEEKLYLSELPKSSTPSRPVTMVPTYTRVDCAREMQKALKALGLYTDVVDGIWGDNSKAAYDAFLS